MAGVVEQFQASSGQVPREHMGVLNRDQVVRGAVHDQRRHPKLGEPRGGVVRGDGLHLGHDHRPGDRPSARASDVGVVEGGVVAKAGGDADLPAGAQRERAVPGAQRLDQPQGDGRRGERGTRPATVGAAKRKRTNAIRARPPRERELLGDHAAHRDAEHVHGVELERVEQPRGVPGEVGNREGLLHATAVTDAAVVVGDHLEVLAQRAQEGLTPAELRAAHADDRQQRRPGAGALVGKIDIADSCERHLRMVPIGWVFRDRPRVAAHHHGGHARCLRAPLSCVLWSIRGPP